MREREGWAGGGGGERKRGNKREGVRDAERKIDLRDVNKD